MGYEFTDEENKYFLSFLQALVVLALTLLFTGTIMFIEGIIPTANYGDSIIGFIFICISILLFYPIQYLLNIIITSGNDMDQFMKGFDFLSKGLVGLMVGSGILLLAIIVSYIQSLI